MMEPLRLLEAHPELHSYEQPLVDMVSKHRRTAANRYRKLTPEEQEAFHASLTPVERCWFDAFVRPEIAAGEGETETAHLKWERSALRKRLQDEESRVDEVLNSTSYRVGRAVTYPARKLKQLKRKR